MSSKYKDAGHLRHLFSTLEKQMEENSSTLKNEVTALTEARQRLEIHPGALPAQGELRVLSGGGGFLRNRTCAGASPIYNISHLCRFIICRNST